MKKALIFLTGAAILLLALWFAHFPGKPNVTIYGFKNDSEISQIALTPLTESQLIDIEARFAAAKTNPRDAQNLFDFIGSKSWPAPVIIAPRVGSGVFSCQAPDGPAVACIINKEAFVWFAFAKIKGPTTINIGQNHEINLLRSE